jgi:hypothetical protein
VKGTGEWRILVVTGMTYKCINKVEKAEDLRQERFALYGYLKAFI